MMITIKVFARNCSAVHSVRVLCCQRFYFLYITELSIDARQQKNNKCEKMIFDSFRLLTSDNCIQRVKNVTKYNLWHPAGVIVILSPSDRSPPSALMLSVR